MKKIPTLSAVIFVCTLMLTACGGGGGGSSSSDSQGTVDVSGRVLDSNESPIAGATVTLASNPIVVTSNSSGNVLPGACRSWRREASRSGPAKGRGSLPEMRT